MVNRYKEWKMQVGTVPCADGMGPAGGQQKTSRLHLLLPPAETEATVGKGRGHNSPQLPQAIGDGEEGL